VVWGPQQIPAAFGWSLTLVERLGLEAAILPFQLAALWWHLGTIGTVPYRGAAAPQRLSSQIAAGFAAFFLVAPTTWIVQFAVRWIAARFGEPPVSNHPLVTQLTLHPEDALIWSLVALQAVVCAPLREEVFFRGILQPWAVHRPFGGNITALLAAVASVVFVGERQPGTGVVFSAMGFVAAVWLLLLAVRRLRIPPRLRSMSQLLFPRLSRGSLPADQVFRGVVGTSLAFSMVHMPAWPDPVPLTVLSLGLGWLAFRTQSLVGPVVCHALFNAMTMYQLRMIPLFNGQAMG
jgi:membrane protease YdiL (CAAX protease family)